MFNPEKLDKIMKEKNISKYKLSKMLNIDSSNISALMNGRIKNPKIEFINSICKALNIEIKEILGEDIQIPKEAIPVNGLQKLPILGTIRAGEPMFAEQNIIGHEYIADIAKPSGECFFLKVVGDSMNLSNITENSLILVRVQNEVENGEIAVVLVDGEEATIKKFFKTDTTVTLMPHSTNPVHQPRIIDIKKVKVDIIGKAVKVVTNL